jgi:hypothetical protein
MSTSVRYEIDIKVITATIPYKTYRAMIGVFDLNCQDDLDALIQNLIEQALDEQLEINQIGEYYE